MGGNGNGSGALAGSFDSAEAFSTETTLGTDSGPVGHSTVRC